MYFNAMVHLLFLLLLLYSGVTYSYEELAKSPLETYRNVRYMAFKKENPTNHEDIRDVDCSGNLTTVFIVHGFFKISLEQPLSIKDEIFTYRPDVKCVIVVSWLEYSTYSGE